MQRLLRQDLPGEPRHREEAWQRLHAQPPEELPQGEGEGGAGQGHEGGGRQGDGGQGPVGRDRPRRQDGLQRPHEAGQGRATVSGELGSA